MRNLKLLEKYQPHPPPAIKEKENLSLQENEKTSLDPRKSFNHPKIASAIMKKTQTPHLKILNFSKHPNSIGKFFNSFEVTRPINPSRKNLNPSPKNRNPSRKMSTLPEKMSTPPEKKSTRPPE